MTSRAVRAVKSTILRGVRTAVKGFVSILPARLLDAVFHECIAKIERNGADFLTFRRRPKSGEERVYLTTELITGQSRNRIGIVIQGPLHLPDNFTVETVRYYRSCSPNSTIIVSTWDDEPEAELQKLRELGAHVIAGEKPPSPGRMNLNYQITSTLRGFKLALELGCTHVAKVRSDIRLYAVHLLSGLPDTLAGFPIANHKRPRERIATISQWTSKFCPLHYSDLFMFGQIDDLIDYWSPPADPLNTTRKEFLRNVQTLTDCSEYVHTSEQYLMQHYLSKIGADPTFSIEYWWNTLAERFLVLDCAQLDVYWPKYAGNVEAPELSAEGVVVGTVMRFLEWHRLYSKGKCERLTAVTLPKLLPSEHLPLDYRLPTTTSVVMARSADESVTGQ